MITEKELIRCALMGDKQAQEECTAKGIVLPCPICGGEIKIKQCDWYMFYPYCNGCKFTFNFLFDSKKDAIEVVNDRPAPPIGRCGECAAYGIFKDNQCANTGDYRTRRDFCSDFERREEE